MATTHRSAILTAPRTLRFESRPLPAIGPGEVRVRLEGCGICGSNLPVWEGRRWFNYPLPAGAPGHEGWGRVDAVGAAVAGLRPGERVALLSQHAFAEYDTARADDVVPLPAALDGKPFPGEALGCVMNIRRRAGFEPGEWVAVVGVGFIGALLIQLAVADGARVIALSRRPFALGIARRMGARELVPLLDRAEAVGLVREITNGRGCPCVIEATGLQSALDVATELTAERGRLVIAGFHQDGPRQVDMQLWNWRGLDVINAHERDARRYAAGMREAVDIVASGRIDPFALFTHQLAFAELADAFEGMRQRPDGFLKGLVTYG